MYLLINFYFFEGREFFFFEDQYRVYNIDDVRQLILSNKYH